MSEPVSEITTCKSVVGFLTRLTVNHLALSKSVTDTQANSNCRLTAGVRLPPSGWLKICYLIFINSQGNVSELIDARAPLDRCAPQVENPWVRVQLGYVEKLPTHFLLQIQNHLTSLQKHRPSVYKVNVQGGSNTLYKKQKKGKTTM